LGLLELLELANGGNNHRVAALADNVGAGLGNVNLQFTAAATGQEVDGLHGG
jgi:hypothetical protein